MASCVTGVVNEECITVIPAAPRNWQQCNRLNRIVTKTAKLGLDANKTPTGLFRGSNHLVDRTQITACIHVGVSAIARETSHHLDADPSGNESLK